ncbi:MAG: hypothetical protein ACK55I_27180, partial [bacterium]
KMTTQTYSWKVTPTYKKSILERNVWVKGDQEIIQDVWWRWGEFFVSTETDQPPVIEAGDDLMSGDYVLEDWSTDDATSEDLTYECDEETEQQVQEFLDEGNSIYDLAEEGWEVSYSE